MSTRRADQMAHAADFARARPCATALRDVIMRCMQANQAELDALPPIRWFDVRNAAGRTNSPGEVPLVTCYRCACVIADDDGGANRDDHEAWHRAVERQSMPADAQTPAGVDLERSSSSALTLFLRPREPGSELAEARAFEYRRVILPGNAVVRIGEHEIFIRQGEEKAVAVDSFDYELVRSAPEAPARRWWRR